MSGAQPQLPFVLEKHLPTKIERRTNRHRAMPAKSDERAVAMRSEVEPTDFSGSEELMWLIYLERLIYERDAHLQLRRRARVTADRVFQGERDGFGMQDYCYLKCSKCV